MGVLSTTFGAAFNPSGTVFAVQANGTGSVNIMRRNSAAAAWNYAGACLAGQAVDVSVAADTAEFKVEIGTGTPTFTADE